MNAATNAATIATLTNPPPNRARGVALMLAAGLCWSLGGIIVRKLTLTDTWEIVFWRALFMAAFLGVLSGALRGRTALASVRSIGVAGAISGVCLAAQIYFCITTVNPLPTLSSMSCTWMILKLSRLTSSTKSCVLQTDQ